jgi:hypothetical protein
MAKRKNNLPPIGTRVKAKRAGWDEDLDDAQQLDLDPVEGADEQLEGELYYEDVPAKDDMPALFLCRVGGQPADPATVETVEK